MHRLYILQLTVTIIPYISSIVAYTLLVSTNITATDTTAAATAAATATTTATIYYCCYLLLLLSLPH